MRSKHEHARAKGTKPRNLNSRRRREGEFLFWVLNRISFADNDADFLSESLRKRYKVAVAIGLLNVQYMPNATTINMYLYLMSTELCRANFPLKGWVKVALEVGITQPVRDTFAGQLA